MQREQFQSRREMRRLREKSGHVLGADLLHIGELSLAERGQRLGGHVLGFVRDVTFSHGLDSFQKTKRSSPLLVPSQIGDLIRTGYYSCSLIAIVLTTFSGSGLARSIDNNPFFRSAPFTCIPSASTKVRWKWRAAMPRWMYCRALSSCCRPRMTSWFSSMVTSSWSRVKPATASVIRSRSGWPLARSQRSML